ncbi:MAG: type II secretion system secretin GspD [Nitrospirae bacterium]|nr:type II secretion system secretin GspD [Nitrospirota bacterium]
MSPLSRAAIGLAFFLLFTGQAPAPGAPARKPTFDPKEKVNIDGEFDIKDLTKTISNLTGKNFILDERVRGKITIISPQPVTVEEAYHVYESVMNVRGFTLVPSGKIMKIIPATDAKQESIPTSVEQTPLPPVETFITRLVPLQYVPADEIEGLLRDLVSRNGVIKSYLATNTLIFIDTSANILRLLRIIDTLDVPGFEDIVEIVRLKYATAVTLAQQISQIFVEQTGRQRRVGRAGSQPGAGGITKIIPDERMNVLIVVGPRLEIEKLKKLIGDLDVPVEAGGGRIRVRSLNYADAEQLAQVLASLVSGLPTRQTGSAGMPGQPSPPSQPGGGGSPSSVTLEGGVKITADKATNSLIIIASQRDYEVIDSVIQQLDVRRKQVYVEGVVMEVSFDRKKEWGIVAHGGQASKDGAGAITFGGTNLGGSSTLIPLGGGTGATGASAGTGIATFAKPGVFFGILGEKFEIDVGGAKLAFPTFGAFLNALASDNDVNILSTPQILTMDNEEAEIIVGSNIPFITQTQQSTLAGAPIIQNIERKDVGINLKVTPQINESGAVRLKISQEISAVSESVPTGFQVGQQGLITRKRQVKNTLVVQDKQTVVIGGLLEDTISISESKVPILGDIPIIGWLFRSSKKTLLKTNLLIFLTPYVLSTPEEVRDLGLRKEQEMRQTIERATKEHRKATKKLRDRLEEPAPPDSPRSGEAEKNFDASPAPPEPTPPPKPKEESPTPEPPAQEPPPPTKEGQ